MNTKSSTTKNFKYFILSVLALVITVGSFAQNINKTGTYSILVKGTSNLHDWTMKASGGGITGSFIMSPGVAHLASIPALSFTMPVKTLKSNESLMDSRAYSSLKANKNPNISFKIVSTTSSNPQANKSTLNVTGLLTIAGVTKQVVLLANSVNNADGSIVITGSKKIKMTEFGIKPPSFMLGALKVGDEVTVEYAARFK